MNHKNRYDAVVVGAGPAGSTAAFLMATNGFKVLILDKKSFPRDKLCGGLLTYKTVRLLEGIFHTSVDSLTSRKVISFNCTRYNVVSSTGMSIKGKLHHPFHFVRRDIYDDLWLKMACQAGAEFRSGEKVNVLDCSGTKVSTDKGHEFYGKFIFGADGVFSKVRRSLAAKSLIEGEWKANLATALEVFIPSGELPELPDYPHIYFGHIPWGYAWCFPGEHRRILGICGQYAKAGNSLRRCFRAFLESLHISMDRIPTPASHALPYGNYLNTPGHDNVLLVGDAGGLADPLLGEGIYYAHKSAQLAAEAVTRNRHNPPAALKAYAGNLNRVVIPEFKYARIGRRIIFSLPGAWPYRVLATLLKIIPQKCEETIQGQRSFKWFRPLGKI
jgi:geranylgeranyl reductase family protein